MRRRGPGSCLAILLGHAASDLLALLGLGAVLIGLMAYVTLLPPTRLAFTTDRAPRHVSLQHFYGVEGHPDGAYRWAKPEATITIPATAPARYHLTLRLRDTPAAQPRRPVTILINGRVAGTVLLDDTTREYRVEHALTPGDLQRGKRDALQVKLQTAPFIPSDDPRPLGVIVAGVAVEPLGGATAWQAALLAPNLLLLLVAYAVMRGAGARIAAAAVVCVALLAIYALLAVVSRPDALFLTYRPAAQPPWLLALLLLLAALPLVARAPFHPRGAWRDRWAAHVPAGVRAALAGGLGGALWLFVTLRIVFSTIAFLSSALVDLPAPCSGGWPAPVMHTTGLDFRLLGVWQRWDGCWYEKIATTSYRPGEPSVAFFPFYPLLIRVAGAPFGDNFTLGGLVVAAAAYVAAVVGIYRLVRDDFDEEVARRTVLYLSVFPTAFFLFAPFTEAPFLALSVWTLYAARRGAWGWAGLAAFLAGLTRIQGCLLALPIAWELWRQWRAGGRPFAALPVPLLPLVSLGLFIAYGKVFTGLTTFEAQRTAWKVAPRTPWEAIAISWQHIRWYDDVIEAVNLGLLAFFALLLIVGLRRLPFSYLLYAAPQLLLITMRQSFLATPLASTSRYVLVLFPAFTILALLGRQRRLHAIHYGWLITSTVLLASLLYLFLSGAFVA